MLAGGSSKTNNHQFSYYWPTLGDRRDFAMYGKVGTWVGKNARTLDRKSCVDCLKIVMDEFPELDSLEIKDFSGRCARSK
jgi:hypothetical protein